MLIVTIDPESISANQNEEMDLNRLANKNRSKTSNI